jgi:hypothetical protein
VTDLERVEIGPIEEVLVTGNLAKLTEEQRTTYYRKVCESLGLNPFTGPFTYINFQGRLILYARKDATDQLRKRDSISVRIASRDLLDQAGLYVVIAQATTPDGRTEESLGAVTISGLKGENLANALMRAETKAKRRVTLSICGLGWLDETEVEDTPVLSGTAAEGARPSNPPVPAGPPITERDRAQLRRQWNALGEAGRAYVRTEAENQGLPWPLGRVTTRTQGDAYTQLISDAAAADDMRAAYDNPPGRGAGVVGKAATGDTPTPDSVHDDAPEASDSELGGGPKYDPADGDPF